MSGDGLQAIISALKLMSGAERHRWRELGHGIADNSPRILTADGGIQAVNMASAAKIIAATVAHCCAENDQESRGVLLSLAVMLENERASQGDRSRPYHMRGDR